MARRLIAVGSAVALVAVLAGVGFLASYAARSTFMRPGGGAVEEDQTARRYAALAGELGRAEQSLELTKYRARIETLLAAAPASDTTSLAVMVDAEEWRDTATTRRIAETIRGRWRDLGLGTTKVAVGVVMIDRGTARRWGRALGVRNGEPDRFFVVPDSLAPATCLVVVVAPPPRIRDQELGRMARQWFGPCAYYARFGIPGARVRRWIMARNFDVALTPDWDPGRPDTLLQIPWLTFARAAGPWYWRVLYMMPPNAVGCLGGKSAACRAAVADGDQDLAEPGDGTVAQTDAAWSFTRQRLVGGEHFLGAVLRATGPRRFAEFWRSPLPVDSALTLLLREPVGSWTAAWQQRVAERPRFGPSLTLLEIVVAVLLAGFALGAVAWRSSLREVA